MIIITILMIKNEDKYNTSYDNNDDKTIIIIIIIIMILIIDMIDMSVPSDSNISAKKFEKRSKYKDLEIEIAKKWKTKTKAIPVIVGTLRMIKKGT